MSKPKTTCQFCSAPLDVTEGSTFAVCEYCGKSQSVVIQSQASPEQETVNRPTAPQETSSPAPVPTQAPEDKVNVVVTQKSSQHNWGCLGFFIGVAILIVVIFCLVKCSGKSSSNNQSYSGESEQTNTRKPVIRNRPGNNYQPPPPKINRNGLPNVQSIPN